MSSTRDRRGTGARRPGAGCPPVLEIDLVHSDELGPAVEWPPAPPTRRNGNGHVAGEDAEVAALTTARAVRLLDASVSHLRTALETSAGEDAEARIERAIADIARARETLTGIDTA